MKKIIIIAAMVCTAFLVGCIPNTSQESTLLLQINGYEAQLKEQPNNPSLLIEIGQRYRQLFEITHKSHYRKHSIDYLKRYMITDTHNPEVQLSLYYSLYSQTLESGKKEDHSKLSKLFNGMTPLTKQRTNPPALAEFLSRSTANKDFNTKTSLLKRAIQEQPNATHPYVYLYGMYASKGHDTLALSVLKQGVDLNPLNTYLKSMLAYSYLRLGETKICTGKQASPIQKSIYIYNELVKNAPKNGIYRLNLADAYSAIGENRLALVHYKASIKLVPNEDALWGAGYTYILLGNLEKAGKMFTEALKLDNTTNQDIGDLEFINGDYIKAKQVYKKAKLAFTNDVYINLKHQISADLSQNKSSTPLTYIKNMTDWEKTLYDYYNRKLKNEELIGYAKDACELTEAYFLQAIIAKQQKNQEEFKMYLEKVAEQKVYSYSEYLMAKGILNKMK
jgi:tetratricopeptide (TPR) repeat protein